MPAARASARARRGDARAGKIELAKVDVDANPGLARAFGIQGIPAVKAFRDGKVAAEFVGAQPPAAVEQFLDSLLPSEADALVELGDEASLRRAHELEPARADAAVPLARILRDRGDTDEALAVLARVPGSFAADGLAARIGLEAAAGNGAPPVPDLSEAFAALDAGEHERALDLLLEALPTADGSPRRRPARGRRRARRARRRRTRSRGTRGAGWPPLCTETRQRLVQRGVTTHPVRMTRSFSAGSKRQFSANDFEVIRVFAMRWR